MLRRFAALSGVAVATSMILTGSTWLLLDVVRSFTICSVYSLSVGGLAYAFLPRLGARCGKLRGPWNWTLFLTACVAAAVAGCLLSDGVLVSLGIFPRARYWALFKVDVKLCIVITLAFGSGMFIYETMRSRLERALLEEERARFSSLEARIHPHFLFNTLNSISALVREDPRKAERTVEQLSALLRYSLDTNSSRLTPLRREIRIVTDYLEIEKTRFGGRLRYSIDVPAALEDLEVPPMAVQTLAENSVKHAISTSRQGGEIRIVARIVEDRFLVEVSDDGPGFSMSDIKEGHGLDSLRARLKSVFSEDAALAISGATVTLSLPQKRVLA